MKTVKNSISSWGVFIISKAVKQALTNSDIRLYE